MPVGQTAHLNVPGADIEVANKTRGGAKTKKTKQARQSTRKRGAHVSLATDECELPECTGNDSAMSKHVALRSRPTTCVMATMLVSSAVLGMALGITHATAHQIA